MQNNLTQLIKSTIKEYSDRHDGQVNLGSPYAQADLTELLYDNIILYNMFDVDDTTSETYNDQQLLLFTNINDQQNK
jgi:hypothetical protein